MRRHYSERGFVSNESRLQAENDDLRMELNNVMDLLTKERREMHMTQSTSLPAIRVPPHLQASSSPSSHSPQTESHLRTASSPKTPPRTPERTAAHGFVSNESMLQAENDDLRSKMHNVLNAARGTQDVLRRLWSQHEAALMQVQHLKAELLQARSQRESMP